MTSSARKSTSFKARAAVTACCALALGAALPAAASACAYADREPVTAEELQAAAKSTHCLVNQIRRDRHKRGLKWNRRLAKSSVWQAGDMLSYGYFNHERSNGPSFNRRILRYGYARSASGYSLGENIAWGTAPAATPRDMVQAWMNSAPHRQNILRRVFREDAVAVIRSEGEASGEYAGYGPVLIYVHQFGKRY